MRATLCPALSGQPSIQSRRKTGRITLALDLCHEVPCWTPRIRPWGTRTDGPKSSLGERMKAQSYHPADPSAGWDPSVNLSRHPALSVSRRSFSRRFSELDPRSGPGVVGDVSCSLVSSRNLRVAEISGTQTDKSRHSILGPGSRSGSNPALARDDTLGMLDVLTIPPIPAQAGIHL